MRFGVIPRGGLGGLPCLILGDDYDTAQDAFNDILDNRGPGTRAVWFDTARSWDVEFMANVNSLLNMHQATVDLTMYLERGVLSKLWPHSSDSMWVSVDCTELISEGGSPLDLQKRIIKYVGPLPVPNEVFITVTEEALQWMSPTHLDMVFSTIMPGEAYVYLESGAPEMLSLLLNKCHTEWRAGLWLP